MAGIGDRPFPFERTIGGAPDTLGGLQLPSGSFRPASEPPQLPQRPQDTDPGFSPANPHNPNDARNWEIGEDGRSHYVGKNPADDPSRVDCDPGFTPTNPYNPNDSRNWKLTPGGLHYVGKNPSEAPPDMDSGFSPGRDPRGSVIDRNNPNNWVLGPDGQPRYVGKNDRDDTRNWMLGPDGLPQFDETPSHFPQR